MSEHPIEGLMLTAMNSIREMVDVNTIIGEPIETMNNIMIIPISKVGFGFASGGSEFKPEAINQYNRRDKNNEEIEYKLPFGGGSGAGVSISPVAFLVVGQDNVKLISVNHSSAVDKLLDFVPDLIEKANCMLNKQMDNKNEYKSKIQEEIEKNIKKQEENNINKNSNTPKVHVKKNKPIKYNYQETEDNDENIKNDIENVNWEEE